VLFAENETESVSKMSWPDPNLPQDLNPVDQDLSWSMSGENVWNDTEDIKIKLNITLQHCTNLYLNKTAALAESNHERVCPVTTDGLLCWPPTPVNETASVKCFAELMHIRYDDTRKSRINLLRSILLGGCEMSFICLGDLSTRPVNVRLRSRPIKK
jgi:hypothetical protein